MTKRKAVVIPRRVQEKLFRTAIAEPKPPHQLSVPKILSLYGDGKRISDIFRELSITRPMAERCVVKGLTFGPLEALRDLPRLRHPTLTRLQEENRKTPTNSNRRCGRTS